MAFFVRVFRDKKQTDETIFENFVTYVCPAERSVPLRSGLGSASVLMIVTQQQHHTTGKESLMSSSLFSSSSLKMIALSFEHP
eukprot:scaffold4223_cov189-Amphora_coffeaeformis.AAC.20